MRRSLIAVGALAALLLASALELRKRRAAGPLEPAVSSEIQAVSGCLLGRQGPSSGPDEDERRARRQALAETQGAWPQPCVLALRGLRGRLARRPEGVSAALLPLADEALGGLGALTPEALRAFREGTSDALPVPWIAPLRALQARVAPTSPGLGSGSPALSSGVGDVLPLPLTPASSLAATSARGGVLRLFFVDPQVGTVLCHTRDQGRSVRCQRLQALSGVVVTLVPGDGPEALVLVEHRDATGSRSLSVASPEALETPLFVLPEPPLRSLPLYVSDDRLWAVTAGAGGTHVVTVPRGGVATADPAPGFLPDREAALARGSDGVWVLRVGPHGLQARRLSGADGGVGPELQVSTLQGSDAVLSRCDTDRGAWVVASDRGEAVVLRVASGAPSRVGAVAGVGFPLQLACDDQGVTLVGSDRVASCDALRCAAGFTDTGTRRFVRHGEGLLRVGLTPAGALRASVHTLNGARQGTVAPRDDAAHGGLSVHNLWLAPAGRAVLLLGAGEPSVALSSVDGVRWDFAREAVEVPLRPLRPRDLLPSRRGP